MAERRRNESPPPGFNSSVVPSTIRTVPEAASPPALYHDRFGDGIPYVDFNVQHSEADRTLVFVPLHTAANASAYNQLPSATRPRGDVAVNSASTSGLHSAPGDSGQYARHPAGPPSIQAIWLGDEADGTHVYYVPGVYASWDLQPDYYPGGQLHLNAGFRPGPGSAVQPSLQPGLHMCPQSCVHSSLHASPHSCSHSCPQSRNAPGPHTRSTQSVEAGPQNQPETQRALQPVLQATAYPVAQPVLQAIAYPVVQPLLRATAHLVVQPVLQATAHPFVQPFFQPNLGLVVAPVFQPLLHQIFEPLLQPCSRPVLQPLVQPAIQPTSQPPFQQALQQSVAQRGCELVTGYNSALAVATTRHADSQEAPEVLGNHARSPHGNMEAPTDSDSASGRNLHVHLARSSPTADAEVTSTTGEGDVVPSASHEGTEEVSPAVSTRLFAGMLLSPPRDIMRISTVSTDTSTSNSVPVKST